jgi:DNA-binding transcriptional LysR family regulator
MDETIRLEDMRLFAGVAEAKSFTGAARVLGVPKQTLSRRIAQLEASLGVDLVHRTTRRLELTELGEAYARSCAEIVRLADEANHAARDTQDVPRGVLRVTADPVFGDAFVAGLVNDYAKRWPEVRMEIALTRRRVDLVQERFDVAFRVGRSDDASSLSAIELGRARVRYCASPAYVARRGAPSTPADLAKHDCLVVSDGGPARWPMPRSFVQVSARLLFTSLSMAHSAALAGLGVALFPEFACADDLRRGRLVAVLGAPVDVGSVWLLHPARRFVPARVRAFIEIARAKVMRFDHS